MFAMISLHIGLLSFDASSQMCPSLLIKKLLRLNLQHFFAQRMPTKYLEFWLIGVESPKTGKETEGTACFGIQFRDPLGI
jgi:hypothetical protein